MPLYLSRLALLCGMFTASGLCWATDAKLEAQLNAVLDSHPTARRTTVALKVVDLKSGEVIFDRFGDRLFTPASNLKIYTSACALDLFGPQHQFPTKIVASIDAETQSIEGPLTLVGGGNSMLSTADLRKLAARVGEEWNVKTIRGEVKVDNSRYSNTRLGPGWMWDDRQYYFNMPVTPLMLDFNTRAVPGKFDSDGDPVRIALEDPAFWIASDFDKMLREQGIELTVETSEQKTNSSKREISYPGPPLSETLKHFNHVSENAVGEVLLHEIAVAKGFNRPTWSDGSKLITGWLHDQAGLENGSFKLVDGSGLSRYNLISADSSTRLLAFMRKHEHYDAYYQSLPAYEVETASGKKPGLVRAKPGGMSGVSTISGYLKTLEGHELAFSLLANGYIGSARPVFALRQKVWSVLVEYQPAQD